MRGTRKPQDPWTLAEGVRDVLRFLARRAPWGVLVWTALCAALYGFAAVGAVSGPMSWFLILIAFVSIPAGAAVGMTLSKGLVDTVRFAGWIPTTLAGAAAVFVVVGCALLLTLAIEIDGTMYRAVVPTMASIGAVAAVFRFTWADA